ncbi:hypothetical protein LF95_13640 [Thalassospira sp. TSL5-1]|nr:hypothetical protein LF95_13640 [Thalassospira sp. TSL5-1]
MIYAHCPASVKTVISIGITNLTFSTPQAFHDVKTPCCKNRKKRAFYDVFAFSHTDMACFYAIVSPL